MKAYYCKGNYAIAVHDSNQVVPDDAYPDTTIILMPDDFQPAFEGLPPFAGQVDTRRMLAPVFNIEYAKEQALLTVKDSLNALSNNLTQYNPQAEILSWPAKETAARVVLEGGTLTDTQKILLNSELSSSGSTDMEGLCHSIIARALLFAKVAGGIAGLRTSMQTAISETTDQKSLIAVMSQFSKAIADFSEQITLAVSGKAPSSTSESSNTTPSTPQDNSGS